MTMLVSCGSAMDDVQLRFQQLNLARVQATRLTVFATYELTEERLALLVMRTEAIPDKLPKHSLLQFEEVQDTRSDGIHLPSKGKCT